MNYSARNRITGSAYPEISSRAGVRGWLVVVGVVPALMTLAYTATPAFSQQTFPPIPDSAQEHGIGAHPNPLSHQHECLSVYCCNLKDCRPLAPGTAMVTPKGWSVPLPDGRRTVVGFADKRLRRSSAECAAEEFGQSAWACYNMQDGEWVLRCFYPRVQGF